MLLLFCSVFNSSARTELICMYINILFWNSESNLRRLYSVKFNLMLVLRRKLQTLSVNLLLFLKTEYFKGSLPLLDLKALNLVFSFLAD